MFQMKKEDKTSGVEIGNLLKKQFRVMIVKTIRHLRQIIEVEPEKIQEMFNK